MNDSIERSPPLVVAGRRVETARRPVRSPFDDREVGTVPIASAAAIEHALATAASAMARQRRAPTPLHEHAAILERAAALIAARTTSLARLISDEAGKPIDFATVEAQRCVDTFTASRDVVRSLATDGGNVLELSAFSSASDRIALVRRSPVGVVAAITPFNFPLNLVAHKLAPAIAAGCPVVLKPAPQSPLSAFALAAILREAGLADDMLSVLACDVDDAAKIVADSRSAMLTFTGSAKVGWQLRAQCGDKRCVLELGGSAVAIVDEDADVAHAVARIVSGGFGYAGQSCISVQRVLGHARIFDELRSRLLEATAQIAFGDPSKGGVVSGPVIDDVAVARIDRTLREAIDRGARASRAVAIDRRVIAPLVLEDVPMGVVARDEEIFAPVVLLDRYETFDDVIDAANQGVYGLQAGIFTQRIDRVMRAWERLEVGGLVHDDVPTFRADAMPYGGVKRSGLGREGPLSTYREMTEERLLVLRRS